MAFCDLVLLSWINNKSFYDAIKPKISNDAALSSHFNHNEDVKSQQLHNRSLFSSALCAEQPVRILPGSAAISSAHSRLISILLTASVRLVPPPHLCKSHHPHHQGVKVCSSLNRPSDSPESKPCRTSCELNQPSADDYFKLEKRENCIMNSII